MLTQEKVGSARLTFQTQAAPAAVAAIVIAVLVALVAAATDWGAVEAHVRIATSDLAILLFDRYILAFEAVSVLLLAAVIGGVFLAKREHGQGG
jgi:NADH:ubiquinone oxidoreductase subunit 6 (subunit J)